MRFLLPLFFSLGITAALAQTGSISGKILDSETNEGMIGATVVVDGTTLGSITDLEGKFLIKNVSPGKVTLRITYVGYEDITTEVTVTDGQTTEIEPVTLLSSAIGLSDVGGRSQNTYCRNLCWGACN